MSAATLVPQVVAPRGGPQTPRSTVPPASRLQEVLAADGTPCDARRCLAALVACACDRLPLPGGGETLARWQALATVARHDLSLAKLFEGHTDALAILAELEAPEPAPGATWAVWAAELPPAKLQLRARDGSSVHVDGVKHWCSGADCADYALVTAWFPDSDQPQLVRVPMAQAGVSVQRGTWNAVGMAGSPAWDVRFQGATGNLVGAEGAYLARAGFWHGGAGVAACWYGGATALAEALHRAVAAKPAQGSAFRLAALGKVDVTLRGTAALLREAAAWIDAHPQEDASAVALRARLAAEDCAALVLHESGRALGAAAFCLDADFARTAADLPVFIRQSHAERDFAALGDRLAIMPAAPWAL